MGRKAVSRLFYNLSIGLTLVLAIVTLGAAGATFIAPAASVALTFVGLALPVLLLCNLVAALYWTIRWRCWLWIPLIAIAGNWWYLSCIWQPGSSAAKPNGRTVMIDQAAGERAAIGSAIDGADGAAEVQAAGERAADGYSNSVLTVISYNVASFNKETSGHTCKQIASFLKSEQAEIVCFQECGINSTFTADSVRAAMSEFPYSLIPYTPDSIPLLQLAVFSKYPIRASRLITYPNSKNCSMWCDISIHGKTIRLFNNHLQTTAVKSNKRHLDKAIGKILRRVMGKIVEEEMNELQQLPDLHKNVEIAASSLLKELHQNFIKRSLQADIVKKQIDASPYPLLVCGDFNSIPSSYSYHIIKGTKGKKGTKSAKLSDGFQSCGHGYMYSYRYLKRLLIIDYILHSAEIEGVDYYSPELTYSDHKPVVMRVRM